MGVIVLLALLHFTEVTSPTHDVMAIVGSSLLVLSNIGLAGVLTWCWHMAPGLHITPAAHSSGVLPCFMG